MMKRLLTALATGAIALMASAQVNATDLKPVRVQLGGIPLPSYTGPLYYALESGLYEKAGLDVKVVTGKVSQTSINAITTGSADIGLLAGLATLQAVEKGQPLVAVGVALGRNGTGFFYDKDATIDGLADLEGKKVLMPNPGTEEVLNALMTREGNDPAKVEMIQVAQIGTLFSMYIGRQADAAVTLVLAGGVVGRARPSKFFGLDQLGLREPMFAWVVSRDYLAENEDTVRIFLRTTYEAVGLLNETPELQVDAFVNNVPGAKPETVVQGYTAVLDYQCAPGENVMGRMSEGSWQQAADLYKGVGQMKQDFDITQVYTNRLFDIDPVTDVGCPQ